MDRAGAHVLVNAEQEGLQVRRHRLSVARSCDGTPNLFKAHQLPSLGSYPGTYQEGRSERINIDPEVSGHPRPVGREMSGMPVSGKFRLGSAVVAASSNESSFQKQ